jgi:hypothetical protein
MEELNKAIIRSNSRAENATNYIIEENVNNWLFLSRPYQYALKLIEKNESNNYKLIESKLEFAIAESLKEASELPEKVSLYFFSQYYDYVISDGEDFLDKAREVIYSELLKRFNDNEMFGQQLEQTTTEFEIESREINDTLNYGIKGLVIAYCEDVLLRFKEKDSPKIEEPNEMEQITKIGDENLPEYHKEFQNRRRLPNHTNRIGKLSQKQIVWVAYLLHHFGLVDNEAKSKNLAVAFSEMTTLSFVTINKELKDLNRKNQTISKLLKEEMYELDRTQILKKFYEIIKALEESKINKKEP